MTDVLRCDHCGKVPKSTMARWEDGGQADALACGCTVFAPKPQTDPVEMWSVGRPEHWEWAEL